MFVLESRMMLTRPSSSVVCWSGVGQSQCCPCWSPDDAANLPESVWTTVSTRSAYSRESDLTPKLLISLKIMQPIFLSLYEQLSQQDQLILGSLTQLLNSWSVWILRNVGVFVTSNSFALGPYRIRISPSLILDSDVFLRWSLVFDWLLMPSSFDSKTAPRAWALAHPTWL